ncbi:MAG: response regulator [Pseudomonadota bacterium]
MQTADAKLKGAVFLVDDDVAVQRAVSALLSAADYVATVFKSGDEFLERLPDLDLEHAAVLLDVCMPGIQGLDLQEKLRAQGVYLPVIVMTAHGDVPMAVRAMRNGAVDFLQKPFTVDEVTGALEHAFSLERPIKVVSQTASEPLLERYRALTPREIDVLREVVDGATNKEIARTLAISPRTVEVHRKNIMSKMNAASFAELMRMAVALNIGVQ